MIEYTVGEFMIDTAAQMRGSRIIIAKAGPDPENAIAVIKLALVLQRHPNIQVRAMVEDWSLHRIIQELY